MTPDPWLPARVTWTPRRGVPVIVEGDYLEDTGAVPRLTCGIYEICAALRLPEPEDEHALRISRVVNCQLALRPWAVLWCPWGRFRIELMPPSRD
ncbi:hypothetical protein MSP7336_02759 [Mycobacterium shimoidei]|uniref:Uncharacterized protein n=1 Tax=Mycobacterium shimoidei TaxID=29313 RepID=A0A375Z0I9_MYCSH|nr:hypothetical protein [Mycobacterium shimoidei]SRX94505.1 hypothetical protein MSP7336_02759 [Mycobacterium shimoidei]